MKKINAYYQIFNKYDFSTVILRRDDINSAIDVFTRINTGGQVLTLFEICVLKPIMKKKILICNKWQNLIIELQKAIIILFPVDHSFYFSSYFKKKGMHKVSNFKTRQTKNY